MFYVVYNNSTGNIVDLSTSLPSLQSSELTIQTNDGDVPDLFYYKWNPTLLKFEAKANVNRVMTVYQFLNRFTAIERIAIKTAAKADMTLSDFMDMLYQAQSVDPDSPDVYGGLYYLSILGLIAQARITQIIA